MPSRQIFKTQIDETYATAVDPLGSIREEDDKLYKFVEFTADGVAGDVQKYASLTAYQASQVAPSATQQLAVAGVIVAAIVDESEKPYGWIQIEGEATLSVAGTGTPAIGDRAISSGTTKTLAKGSGEFAEAGTWLNATTGVYLRCIR